MLSLIESNLSCWKYRYLLKVLFLNGLKANSNNVSIFKRHHNHFYETENQYLKFTINSINRFEEYTQSSKLSLDNI